MELLSPDSQPKSPRRLSSIKETAYEFSVHPNTIRKHIHEGKIEIVRVGRRVLIPREAIEKFIADQKL